jgi:hypothetical protein
MKLVFLMHLEGDGPVVGELLEHHGVTAFSSLPIEGHGAGVGGWYGEVPPYRSQMIFMLVSDALADEILESVEACTRCQHANHPIHAIQIDVDRAVASRAPIPPPAA